MCDFRPFWPLLAVIAAASPANTLATGPFDDPQYCQPFDDTLFSSFSYTDEWLVADDFVADGSTLSQVRVWGFYYRIGEGGDCAPPLTFDHFQIRVFENNPITGRGPDVLFAESVATSQHLALADSLIETTWGSVMYQIDLTLETPISGLIPGQVYWMEASNLLTNSFGQTVNCIWFWSRKNQTSSSYFWFGNTENSCDSGGPSPFDQAFCLNFPLGQSPVGAMPGACCTCDGVCTERTLKDCDDLDGIWDVERTSCTGVVCDTTPPNDNCADGPSLISEGFHTIPKKCTTTDGYGPIDTDFGLSQIEGDTWYKFITPPGCALSIDTCWTYASCFDSMLAVYHNPTDPTVCPPCALLSDPSGAGISAATLAGMGADENCGSTVTPNNGSWNDLVQLGRNALPGECFLIRVGNFPGTLREVEGTLHVACDFPPPPLEPDPSGFNKSRFISFQIPPQSIGQTAIRIQLTSLHHLAPCYILCSPPFTYFEGQSVWVGPPSSHVESASSGPTFQASSTQCTPHYQDWSTVGLLHVTGSAIVPSSSYQVEQLESSCQGRENESDCLPGGVHVSSQLQIKTTRWGDVEVPFNPPSATVQPDLGDISALVNKFKSAPGAPIKARALLAGTDQFGTIDLSLDLSFAHIAACVDAFRGMWYPYRMGRCAIGGNACTFNSDCNLTGGPPCVLYCP